MSPKPKLRPSYPPRCFVKSGNYRMQHFSVDYLATGCRDVRTVYAVAGTGRFQKLRGLEAVPRSGQQSCFGIFPFGDFDATLPPWRPHQAERPRWPEATRQGGPFVVTAARAGNQARDIPAKAGARRPGGWPGNSPSGKRRFAGFPPPGLIRSAGGLAPS
jgi:hypothetical protein